LIDVLRLERHSNTVAQASLADTANEIAELSDFVQPVGSVAVKFGVIVTDTPEHEAEGRIPRIERVPFRQELDRMIAAGTTFPCPFASTEY
jgi:hypothetical protein